LIHLDMAHHEPAGSLFQREIVFLCCIILCAHPCTITDLGSSHEFDLFLTYLYLSSNKRAKYQAPTQPSFEVEGPV
jgi:hypothetical protein